MNIKEINKNNTELFKLSGNVFLSPEWNNLFGDSVKIYGIFDKNNSLKGGFHLFHTKAFIFKYIKTLPYTQNINLYYQFNSKNKSKQISEIKKILKLVSDYINNLKADIKSIYLPPVFTDMQPFFWNQFKPIPYYTYLIDLKQNFQNIEKNFSPERRNDIKKALKENIVCEKTTDNKIINKLVQHTFERKNVKINQKYINKILFEFANELNSFAFVSYQNNKPIAMAFSVFDKSKAYYILGGYDKNNKHPGAGALAVYESIKYAKNLNINYFDFEGSMIPEIEKYFRGFGGELTHYFSANKAKFLLEIILKFSKRSIF